MERSGVRGVSLGCSSGSEVEETVIRHLIDHMKIKGITPQFLFECTQSASLNFTGTGVPPTDWIRKLVDEQGPQEFGQMFENIIQP